MAGILALLALTAFLLRWRAIVILLITVPLSFVAAALVLDLSGATMNTVALVGLLAALALVIDDAIVTVDAIDVADARGRSGSRAPRAISRGVRSTCAARACTRRWWSPSPIVPVYFLEQVSGAFFPDAATSYLLALLAALVVSITVTPALAVLLLTRPSLAGGESPLVRLLRRALRRVAAAHDRAPASAPAGGRARARGGRRLARLDGPLDAADPQGEPGAGALGCRSGHVAARDGPPHRARCQRVARLAGRDRDRGPRRPGRDCRSDRRRQLRRAVGHDRAPSANYDRTLASIRT